MKKQFFRVKQLADQTFSRAGKTEALSEDLISAEKRIEFLNKVCQNVSKKIMSTLLGQGQDTAAREKRLRKSQEYLLAVVLFESGSGDVEDILKHILVESSKVQLCLANAITDTDARMESSIILPLQQIIENDVPNIIKQKRCLTRLILDMDSSKNRYQAALKHTSNSNSTGNTTKADSIKDELEDIEMKVEQCRDSLACDMFQLISKETILANVLLDYIKLQQTAHRTALALLDEMVPELETTIENSNMKPVFGFPLEEHLKVTNRKIAYPLELCVCVLLEFGMEEEGLFRMAGGASKIRRLKFGLDANFITMETAMEYRDVHVISSVLKSYFRELPEPLLTFSLYDEWLAAIRYQNDENGKLAALWAVLHKLPQPNFDNLRYLIKFLSILTKNQECNKMTPQNLAIVIAPNLIWNHTVNISNIGENMNLANQYSAIVEYLVKYADWFFPGEETFYITLEEVNNRTKRHARSNSADLRLLSTEFTSTSESTSIKRCQSTTNLEEQVQNCPMPESPKPITRTRKSKPAPIPPIVSNNNILTSATITQSTAHNANISAKDKVNASILKLSNTQQYFKKHGAHEFSPTNEDISVSRHESFSFKEQIDKTDTCIDEDKEEKSPKNLKFKNLPDENVQSVVSPDITKLLSVESINKILETKKLQKPIPAPRVSLESHLRVSGTDDISPRKPVIPEKPSTLQRPMSCSFKSFKISDIVDVNKIEVEKSKGPSLEKAHLYSVDKQQVSFIDIASHTEDNAANEVFSDQENSTTTLRPRPSSSSDRSSGDKVIGSPKLGMTCDRGQNSSHTRALSDGYSIETSSPVSLPLHRSFHRIQRPIPPPPPPPVMTKSQTRSGPVNDSTNL